ncbi:hypothetical protein [Hydrogenophaga taeniospiralis]|jgi:hypothetical protein|nr:hypothetical protein [Hydrogenophaga taeniospiralis]
MRPLALKTLVWAGVLLVLLGTLALYQRPDFLVNLADQLWSCF